MSNSAVIKEDKLNYLLVEGAEDAQVFFHLLRHYKLETHITIQQKDGVERLLASLEVELLRRSETRIGIIVDADIDPAARWKSLRSRIAEAGYANVPLYPEREGTILSQVGHPIIGLWLMPNNTISGMLEDFVSTLIPSKDVLWPVAKEVVHRVSIKDRRFPQTQTMKAQIHTWLAWQEEPGKPMGQAITKRYLDASAVHAQQLVSWIHRLFDVNQT